MSEPSEKVKIATLSALAEATPTRASAAGMDLVVVRRGDEVVVLYGRCPHRGAPMGDGHVDGPDLVCKAHGWDFRLDTGLSPSIDGECLARFRETIDREADAVYVDAAELRAWQRDHPQAFHHDEYLGG